MFFLSYFLYFTRFTFTACIVYGVLRRGPYFLRLSSESKRSVTSGSVCAMMSVRVAGNVGIARGPRPCAAGLVFVKSISEIWGLICTDLQNGLVNALVQYTLYLPDTSPSDNNPPQTVTDPRRCDCYVDNCALLKTLGTADDKVKLMWSVGLLYPRTTPQCKRKKNGVRPSFFMHLWPVRPLTWHLASRAQMVQQRLDP